MATLYTIICPECGFEFNVLKGIRMSEAHLNPIPEDRLEETPFICPMCGLEMSTQDEDFHDHVTEVAMID